MSFTKAVLFSLIAFFAPISGIAIGMGLLVILDTITGLVRAYKTGEKIRSRRLGQMATKSLIYLLVLYMVFPVDYYLLNSLTMLMFDIEYLTIKVIAISFSLIELTSIKENIELAFKIDIFNLIKKTLSRATNIKEDITKLNN